MTPAEMLPLLTEWRDLRADLFQQLDALTKLTGGGDGPLHDAVWRVWNAYTAQLAHRVGDTCQWLEWHSQENDMGRKGLEVSSPTLTVKVRTLRLLAAVIADSRP